VFSIVFLQRLGKVSYKQPRVFWLLWLWLLLRVRVRVRVRVRLLSRHRCQIFSPAALVVSCYRLWHRLCYMRLLRRRRCDIPWLRLRHNLLQDWLRLPKQRRAPCIQLVDLLPVGRLVAVGTEPGVDPREETSSMSALRASPSSLDADNSAAVAYSVLTGRHIQCHTDMCITKVGEATREVRSVWRYRYQF